MKYGYILIVVLMGLITAVPAYPAPIGNYPGLQKLIDSADAIVILRIDRHLSGFGSSNFYSTHECFIYQTLKGNIAKNTRITLQLRNNEASFATPYAHGSTHLMFLMKKAREDEPTEYRTLTFKGAQILLSPLGNEKTPEGKTIEEQIKNLIRGAIEYREKEHKKNIAFLETMLGKQKKQLPLSLELKPENNQKFTFGQYTPTTFVLKNLSEKALVVLGIKSITNSTEDPIRLSGSAYGSIEKKEGQDTYSYNRMSQMQTRIPFYAGFLLPSQQVTIKTEYRPVALKESFDIAYVSASRSYNGTADSLKPLNPYVPKHVEGRRRFPNNYYPYVEQDWLILHKAHPQTMQVGPDAPQRAVLMPDLEKAEQYISVTVPIDYNEVSFPLEVAKTTASRISGLTPNSLQLVYSAALDGFVVLEDGHIWVLKSENQVSKGELFSNCPSSFFKDIDLKGAVRIRVGDKQEGFGPEEHPAERKLWDIYPVYYGDGMYTRGEFISIEKKNLLSFLQQITEKKMTLKERHYYFMSRYFNLISSDID